MNRNKLVSFFALLILILVVPVYAWMEPARMEQAQADLRQEYVSDAAILYVENCAVCHGAEGEGIGATPSLDNDGLRTADYDMLFKTIARGRYDTAMAPFHTDEGGSLTEYQIDELVTLIRYGDWPQVRELAALRGLIPPTMPVPEIDETFLAEISELDGGVGAQWAEGFQLYAANCTLCHGINGEGSEMAVPLNTPEIRATDADALQRIISEGVAGTLMVGWGGSLQPAEIESLAAFLQNWDKIEAEGIELVPPEPIRIDINNPEEMLALGERIYNSTCIVCHGENGSGGTGPVLNSQQILTRNSDEQLYQTVVNGGHRPNSSMPAFGDRLTSVEIEAVVSLLRSWEPTAPWVENPRGTAQGGGPPWMRATPDPANPIVPETQQGHGGGQGRGNGRGGGPPWRNNN